MPQSFAERFRAQWIPATEQPGAQQIPPVPPGADTPGILQPEVRQPMGQGQPQTYPPNPMNAQVAPPTGPAPPAEELMPGPGQSMAERFRASIPSAGDVAKSVANVGYQGAVALMPGQQPGEPHYSTSYGRRVLNAAMPDAAAAVKDLTAPIHSPIDTAKGMAGMAQGLVSLAIPGTQPSEQHVRVAAAHLLENYGSPERVKEAFAERPFRTVRDIAGVLTGSPLALAGVAGETAGEISGAVTDPSQLPMHLRPAELKAESGMDRVQSAVYKAGNKAMRFMGNTAMDAAKVAGDVGYMANPLNWLEMGDSFLTLGEGIVRGVLQDNETDHPSTQAAREALEMMVTEARDKYGTFDNLKKTLATRPVTSMMDLMSVMTGSVGAANKVGRLLKASQIDLNVGDDLTPRRKFEAAEPEQPSRAAAAAALEQLQTPKPSFLDRARAGIKTAGRAVLDPVGAAAAGLRAGGRLGASSIGQPLAFGLGKTTQKGTRNVASLYRAGRGTPEQRGAAFGHLNQQTPADEIVREMDRGVRGMRQELDQAMKAGERVCRARSRPRRPARTPPLRPSSRQRGARLRIRLAPSGLEPVPRAPNPGRSRTAGGIPSWSRRSISRPKSSGATNTRTRSTTSFVSIGRTDQEIH